MTLPESQLHVERSCYGAPTVSRSNADGAGSGIDWTDDLNSVLPLLRIW